MQTEVCRGIRSADRGLCGHRVCRQRCVGASGLPTEVVGLPACRERACWGIDLQTEVCAGMGYGERGPVGASVQHSEVCVGIGPAY